MQRIINFLNEAGGYFLATVDGTRPCIRPFGSCLLFEGRLYMCMGDFKNVYRQLMKNPNIAIAALDSSGSWLRIAGEAVFDDRPEPVAAMYKLIPSLHKLYSDQGRALKVCYIKNGHAQFNLPDGAQEEFEF